MKFSLEMSGPFLPSLINYEMDQTEDELMIRIKRAAIEYEYFDEDGNAVFHKIKSPLACGDLTMELVNTTTGYVELEDLWINQKANKIEGFVIIDTMNKTLLRLDEFERW